MQKLKKIDIQSSKNLSLQKLLDYHKKNNQEQRFMYNSNKLDEDLSSSITLKDLISPTMNKLKLDMMNSDNYLNFGKDTKFGSKNSDFKEKLLKSNSKKVILTNEDKYPRIGAKSPNLGDYDISLNTHQFGNSFLKTKSTSLGQIGFLRTSITPTEADKNVNLSSEFKNIYSHKAKALKKDNHHQQHHYTGTLKSSSSPPKVLEDFNYKQLFKKPKKGNTSGASKPKKGHNADSETFIKQKDKSLYNHHEQHEGKKFNTISKIGYNTEVENLDYFGHMPKEKHEFIFNTQNDSDTNKSKSNKKKYGLNKNQTTHGKSISAVVESKSPRNHGIEKKASQGKCAQKKSGLAYSTAKKRYSEPNLKRNKKKSLASMNLQTPSLESKKHVSPQSGKSSSISKKKTLEAQSFATMKKSVKEKALRSSSALSGDIDIMTIFPPQAHQESLTTRPSSNSPYIKSPPKSRLRSEEKKQMYLSSIKKCEQLETSNSRPEMIRSANSGSKNLVSNLFESKKLDHSSKINKLVDLFSSLNEKYNQSTSLDIPCLYLNEPKSTRSAYINRHSEELNRQSMDNKCGSTEYKTPLKLIMSPKSPVRKEKDSPDEHRKILKTKTLSELATLLDSLSKNTVLDVNPNAKFLMLRKKFKSKKAENQTTETQLNGIICNTGCSPQKNASNKSKNIMKNAEKPAIVKEYENPNENTTKNNGISTFNHNNLIDMDGKFRNIFEKTKKILEIYKLKEDIWKNQKNILIKEIKYLKHELAEKNL